MFSKVRRPSEVDQCACGNPKAVAAKKCRECWKRGKVKPIPVSDDPSYALVPLTKGMNAKVDWVDFSRVMQRNWQAQWNPGTNSYYAMSSRKGSRSMHGYIMETSVMVDHANHDTLDNRRENLRVCDRNQNRQNHRRHKNNSSGVSGVSFHKKSQTWAAYINSNGKRKYLGQFQNKKQAIAARKEAEPVFHAEFAYRGH